MSKGKLEKEKILGKLQKVTWSAESIQSTATYIVQFKKYADQVVEAWFEALKNASSDQKKLSLFYLANEILQTCKRYHAVSFRSAWKSVLPEALRIAKASPFVEKVQRILNIWEERDVYETDYIKEMSQHLAPDPEPEDATNDIDPKLIENYNPEEALDSLRELLAQEREVASKQLHVENLRVDLSEPHLTQFKDKEHGRQHCRQLEEAYTQFDDLAKSMQNELDFRERLGQLLEQAEIFYHAQYKDAMVVVNAYKSYGNRIARVKETLEEHMDFLPDDMVPSVDIEDAPSPGNTPPHLKDVDLEDVDADLERSAMARDEDMDVSDEERSESQPIAAVRHRVRSTSGGVHDRPYSPTAAGDAQMTSEDEGGSVTTVMGDAQAMQIVSGYRPPPPTCDSSTPPPPPPSSTGHARDPRMLQMQLPPANLSPSLAAVFAAASGIPPPPPPPPPPPAETTTPLPPQPATTTESQNSIEQALSFISSITGLSALTQRSLNHSDDPNQLASSEPMNPSNFASFLGINNFEARNINPNPYATASSMHDVTDDAEANNGDVDDPLGHGADQYESGDDGGATPTQDEPPVEGSIGTIPELSSNAMSFITSFLPGMSNAGGGVPQLAVTSPGVGGTLLQVPSPNLPGLNAADGWTQNWPQQSTYPPPPPPPPDTDYRIKQSQDGPLSPRDPRSASTDAFHGPGAPRGNIHVLTGGPDSTVSPDKGRGAHRGMHTGGMQRTEGPGPHRLRFQPPPFNPSGYSQGRYRGPPPRGIRPQFGHQHPRTFRPLNPGQQTYFYR